MKTTKILLTLSFLVIISTPLLLQCLGIDLNTGNKKTEKAPEFSLAQTTDGTTLKSSIKGFYRDIIHYKNAYDKFYKSNFQTKSVLFNVYYNIQTKIFSSLSLPKKVVEGIDGWFFLGDSYSNAILESKGINNFSNEELVTIKENLLNKKAWLEKKRIQFYVAIAPNKHSVYGQYLPIKKSNKKTKLEQLKEIISADELNFIDLAELYPQHLDKRLYHKTNTHWNDIGAFWAYKSLIAKIQKDYPEIIDLKLENFTHKVELSYQEDLTGMLEIKREEERLLLHNNNSTAKSIKSKFPVPFKYKHIDYESRYKSQVNKIKLFVFRDSFCTNLKKFLKENFGESIFLWAYFNEKLIEQEKPDIVILEIVERDLDQLLEIPST
jgi:alginate O-acetyltransferase complex protein AlgJ